MRIAQIAPPWINVPPAGYGGIEWIVSLLADGLVDAGHDVTVFAPGGSKTKAKLASPFQDEQRYRIGETFPDVVHALDAYLHEDEFDIIHDHSGIIGPAIGAFCNTPVLHTFHGPFTDDAKRLYTMLSGRIWYNAISDYQRSRCPDLSYIGTIYNSIRIEDYPFEPNKDDYLMFLGRLSPLKGAHLAVEAASRLGMKLKIVGKVDPGEETEYYQHYVQPHIDGEVEFIGEISADEKARLLGKAKALLFPIQWPEPFGLVMPEAFACGTPVIAFRNGSVPEVMKDGVNGFIVDTVEEMVEAVGKLDQIDPMACRNDAVERFGVQRMVDDYVDAYGKVIQEESRRQGRQQAVS